ncbi:ROK family protein [Arthrobacter sp. ISL-28]|nr:ROK family protein [Arthrobacter sp. ISL-28]
MNLIVETSNSAEGPLRQIVAALPGCVQNGTTWSGTPESRKIFMDSLLKDSIEDRLKAPVILESDASASLRGILKDDASIGNAVLFMLSTVLSFASCTDHEIALGRTSTFRDLGGVLFCGVGNETLDGLLSTKGLLQFAGGRGLDLEGVEALWSQPQEAASRAEVVEAFTTAIVTAVGAVAATLDPESVYFVGRLSPLVDEVLPEARWTGAKTSHRPEIRVVSQVIGLSVARGAAYAGLALAQSRLRESMLEDRREGQSLWQAIHRDFQGYYLRGWCVVGCSLTLVPLGKQLFPSITWLCVQRSRSWRQLVKGEAAEAPVRCSGPGRASDGGSGSFPVPGTHHSHWFTAVNVFRDHPFEPCVRFDAPGRDGLCRHAH